MIKPIVIGNTGMASTGKLLEGFGKSSSWFEEFFEKTIGKDKEEEVNVETSGLLAQLLPNISINPSQMITNSTSELTENKTNEQELITTGKEILLQQDQPYILPEGEQILGKKIDIPSDSVKLQPENTVKSIQSETSKDFQVLSESTFSLQSKESKGDKNSSLEVELLISNVPSAQGTLKQEKTIPSILHDTNHHISDDHVILTAQEPVNQSLNSVNVATKEVPSEEIIRIFPEPLEMQNENNDVLESIKDIKPKFDSNNGLLNPYVPTGKTKERVQTDSFPKLEQTQPKNSLESFFSIQTLQNYVPNGNGVEKINISGNNPMERGKDFKKTESQESFQLKENVFNPLQLHPIESSNSDAIVSVDKPVVPITLTETQFHKEIDKFFKSVFHVHNSKDKIEATFSLTPEHLGKVEVKVSIKDGNITADFFASSSSGKDLLETNIHVLKAALETQGFQVDKINVSQQNISSFMGSFSQKGESNPNGRQTQQESKKRTFQSVQNKGKEYQEFDLDSSSQINTTA